MSGKQYMEQHSQTSRRIACMCYNGELRGLKLAKALVARADLLIAADGG